MGATPLQKEKQSTISTFDVYKGLGYKSHKGLKLLIEAHRDLFLERGPLVEGPSPSLPASRQARPDKGYLLNDRQLFMLACLAKNSPQAVGFKVRLEAELHRMRSSVSGTVDFDLLKDKPTSGPISNSRPYSFMA